MRRRKSGVASVDENKERIKDAGVVRRRNPLVRVESTNAWEER